jgi:maleate isomerase
MYGRGGRIGLAILDIDLTIEGDMRRLLPEEFEVHVSRVIYPHGVTAENLAVAVRGLENAIQSLLPVLPASIAWACTSGSFFGGKIEHEKLLERMRRLAGDTPVTTASGSVVDALRALGARRPAVGTPYSAEINELLNAFLRDYGFDPHPAKQMFERYVDDYTLQDVEETAVADFIRSLDRPDADAVVVSCTGLPTVRVVDAMERELGKPVVTSNLALYWNSRRLGRLPPRAALSSRLLQIHS